MEKKRSTKDLISDSMLELLDTRQLEDITVADICHNCGVSVRSFYNHYHDRNELVSSICLNPIQEYVQSHRENLNFKDLLLMTTTLVADHLSFFRNTSLYQGQNNLKDSIAEPLVKIYMSCLHMIRPGAADRQLKEIEPSVRFFVYGCLQYATYVIFTDIAEKPEESANYFYDCMPWKMREFIVS